jgi:hypothetical protein
MILSIIAIVILVNSLCLSECHTTKFVRFYISEEP